MALQKGIFSSLMDLQKFITILILGRSQATGTGRESSAYIMEGLGCNWKESLTSGGEILVLMNPMYLHHFNHFDLQLLTAAELEKKNFLLCNTMGGNCSLQRRCASTEMLVTLSLGTAFTRSTCYIKWLQLFLYTHTWDFMRNPIRLAKTGWSGDQLNLHLEKWTRSIGLENFHVKQGWAVKYKYPHD